MLETLEKTTGLSGQDAQKLLKACESSGLLYAYKESKQLAQFVTTCEKALEGKNQNEDQTKILDGLKQKSEKATNNYEAIKGRIKNDTGLNIDFDKLMAEYSSPSPQAAVNLAKTQSNERSI